MSKMGDEHIKQVKSFLEQHDDTHYDKWLENQVKSISVSPKPPKDRAQRIKEVAEELKQEFEPLMAAIIRIVDLEDKLEKLKDENNMLSWRK